MKSRPWILSAVACVVAACGGSTAGEAGSANHGTNAGGVIAAGGNVTGGTSTTSSGGNVTGGTSTTGSGGHANGGTSTTGSGGNAAGGSAAGGSAGNTSCSNVKPCGGDLIGIWNVTSSCLKVMGQMDLLAIGIGCVSAPVTGTLHVTGWWSADSDGSFSDHTTTTGVEQFTLAPQCIVGGTMVHCSSLDKVITLLGYSSVICTDAADGGCNCAATVEQDGGMGVVSQNPSTRGNHTSSDNVVTTTDGQVDTPYSYCVSGSTLTMTPQTAMPITTGAIVLEKQ
jgi:hypothetical protein